jgi:1-pyrroline-5-carboxylate dehydrogenase
VPRSLWEGGLRDRLAATADSLTYGDVTDFGNFGGAVIDSKAFDRHTAALEMISSDDSCRILAGGTADDSVGYFVRPTLFECSDATHESFTTEYFGPILGVHVFDDARFDDAVAQAESIAPYALFGSISPPTAG